MCCGNKKTTTRAASNVNRNMPSQKIPIGSQQTKKNGEFNFKVNRPASVIKSR